MTWLHVLWARTPVLRLQHTDRTGDHHRPFTASRNAIGIVRPAPILEAIRRRPADDVYMFLEVIHPFEATDETVLGGLRAGVQYWREALA